MQSNIFQLLENMRKLQAKNAETARKIVYEKKRGVALKEKLAQFDDRAAAEDAFTTLFR